MLGVFNKHFLSWSGVVSNSVMCYVFSEVLQVAEKISS